MDTLIVLVARQLDARLGLEWCAEAQWQAEVAGFSVAATGLEFAVTCAAAGFDPAAVDAVID